MIKPIETHYAGCRFRSRLEARWAVFFDALGIKWEYEPEGFETSAGNYLPDFYLSEFDFWFEVKPDNASKDPRHEAFAKEIAAPLIVARGMPKDGQSQDGNSSKVAPLQVWIKEQWIGCAFSGGKSVTNTDPFDSSRYTFNGGVKKRASCWLTRRKTLMELESHNLKGFIDGNVGILVNCSRLELELPPGSCLNECCAPHYQHGAGLTALGIDKAYAAARSARFEHGETPRRNV